MSWPLSLTFTPSSGSFPFPTKHLPLSGARIVLGAGLAQATATEAIRIPTKSNGWFGPKRPEDAQAGDIYPLPLSAKHAEVWSSGNKVYIRDLDTPFGTFVNNARITQETELKSGDVVSLGTTIHRNSKTPTYITDYHLSPVIARITVSR